MPRRENLPARFAPNLYFTLLVVFLVALWIAGGASRADVLGQVLIRTFAWAIAIILILFAPRPNWQAVRPLGLFLLAATGLVALQLVPLPPSLWPELPGRQLLLDAASVTGREQPWRPLSISPGSTINALSALIVPIVALILLAGLLRKDQWRVLSILLGIVVASSVVGLLQFSGARFGNPLINDVSGAVSGLFANRNHFALFTAIGCLLAPAWAFRDGDQPAWKGFVAVALLLLFGLIILGSGSRAGLLVGVVGVVIGVLLGRQRIKSELRRLPKKARIFLFVAILGSFGSALVLSVTMDRAISVERAFSLDAEQDMRTRALPTVLDITRKYFPVGSGFGAFDPVYRIDEPSELLGTSYFNHAHNDFLEVILDGGFPGLLLLLAAIIWWLWKSVRAWRQQDGSENMLPRVGSGIILLVLIASATDYPARTPMIMAVLIIAAVWLNGDAVGQKRSRVRSVTI